MYSICAESGEDINLEISATRKTIDQVAEYPSVIGFWQRKISTSGWKDHPEEGKELDLPWEFEFVPVGEGNIRWEAVLL